MRRRYVMLAGVLAIAALMAGQAFGLSVWQGNTTAQDTGGWVPSWYFNGDVVINGDSVGKPGENLMTQNNQFPMKSFLFDRTPGHDMYLDHWGSEFWGVNGAGPFIVKGGATLTCRGPLTSTTPFDIRDNSTFVMSPYYSAFEVVGVIGNGTLTLNGGYAISVRTISPTNAANPALAAKLTIGGTACKLNTASPYPFTIDVLNTGGVAGTDYDWVAFTTAIDTLAKHDLKIDVAPSLGGGALLGQTLTIVTGPNTASVAHFGSVTFSGGWSGTVNYTASGVTLTNVKGPLPKGTVVVVR